MKKRFGSKVVGLNMQGLTSKNGSDRKQALLDTVDDGYEGGDLKIGAINESSVGKSNTMSGLNQSIIMDAMDNAGIE